MSRWTTPLVLSAPGTADAALAGIKIVTRRLIRSPWIECERWRPGALSKLYRRSPRAHGQIIGVARIEDVRIEALEDITPEEVRLEGFAHFSVQQFIELFKALHPGHNKAWNVRRIRYALVRAGWTPETQTELFATPAPAEVTQQCQ